MGASYELEYRPFIDLSDPIMPFKEKMLWANYQVLAEVLETPRFSELSIGEDAVIAAVAWLSNPDACFAVYGIATFLHLGFERPPELGDQDIEGGYADLMNYDPRGGALYGKYDMPLRTGVTPFHIMPDVFVPEDHPRYIFNGIRDKVVVGMRPSVKLWIPVVRRTSRREMERSAVLATITVVVATNRSTVKTADQAG